MNYLYSIVTVVAIFSLLTLALNLQFGDGGVINFGLVAYFAVGAFVYSILIQPPPSTIDAYKFGPTLSPWLAAPLGIVAAVIFAYVVGRPALRLRPEYLALATFAFAQMLLSVLINVRGLANGTAGLSQIAPPGAGAIPFNSYDLWFTVGVVVLAAVVYVVVTRLARSPFGQTLRATRDDEVAAAALGKNVARFRMKAFLLGSAIAGLAGVAYASYTTVMTPGLVTANVTFTAFIALVIGGLGSNFGAVVGATIFFGLEALLKLIPISADTARLVESARLIPFGLVLVLVLRFAPGGIVGGLSDRRTSARRARAAREAVAAEVTRP